MVIIMEIYSVKLNGMTNPVGCLYDSMICSWKVRNATGKKQKTTTIEISTTKNFQNLVYTLEGPKLNSVAQSLEFRPEPYTRYYFRVIVTSDIGEVAVSQTHFFEAAKEAEPWDGKWIGLQSGEDIHPLFRKLFICEKAIDHARLYICGLGLFEAYINGQKAGNDLLAPFVNDYYEHLQYCTYDITESIQSKNTIDVYLGNGWYKGRFGVTGHSGFFGKEFALIAEIRVTYTDGTYDVICTDESWQYQGSIFSETDIYDGEVQNYLLWENTPNPWRQAALIAAPAPLIARYSLPVHAMEALPVQNVIYTPAGETVLDFGQNFAGHVECHQLFPKGAVLRMECAEVLQNGNFYHDNYKGAKSEFVYISDGMSRTIRPWFTFFGFRYIKITSSLPIDPALFVGRAVYSEMERTGFISTSHEKLNRLYENCLWSMRSNFLDMPTDCPQRDERLGWTGDAMAFCKTAGYHMDTQAFYSKFLRDLRTDQLRNQGRVAIYMPNTTPGVASSVWSDIATFLPDMCYTYYGSKELLRQHYPLMRDWVEYIRQKDIARGSTNLYDFDPQFGDWLALDGVSEQSVWGRTDSVYLSTMYYYASTRLVASAADTLQLPEAEEYRTLADQIKASILQEFYSPSGRLTVDTQTGYLLALNFQVYHSREKILEGLKQRLERDNYRVRTGFVGTALMPTVFGDNDMVDEFYDFLFYEGFPGWLYAINLGATTIWERWNSLSPDGSISGTSMHSLNHYAFGSVVEFLYRYTAGIIPVKPGFREIRLEPKPNWRLHSFNCRYDSPAGTYVSKWHFHSDGRLTVDLEIPFGAEAIVTLPDSETAPFRLSSGCFSYTYMPKRDYRTPFNEHTRLEILAEHKAAVEVLKEYLPRKYEAICTGNVDELSCTLADELRKTQKVGYPPERLDSIERAVVDMFCFPEADLQNAISAIKQIKVEV